jgi:undecaprenyl-diphosphatase
VSSSAHLLLLPRVLGQQDPGLAFDVILHLGTLFATLFYFFKDWVQVIKTPLPKATRSLDPKRIALSWVHLGVGTLPAVVAGVLLNQFIQEHLRSLMVLWVTLPGFGLLLWWVDRKCRSDRHARDASVKDLFIIGCVQAISLIPGVSRSGSTMTAARALGFQRGDAARLSFLLSMPVTLGAIAYEGRHWESVVASVNGVSPLVWGCLAAFISGALAIHYLIQWVSRASFAIFAIYRVILGLAVAVFLS